MKKSFGFVCALALLSAAAAASPAMAGGKGGNMWWWQSHWQNMDFKPYYDNGTDPHNSQWSQDPQKTQWTPADWIAAVGGKPERLVQKWLDTKILVGSYKDREGVSYLEIGPNFYHLSGYDKQRVTRTLDAIYQVTAHKPAMFFIKDEATGKIIGTYSKEGLILE